MKKQDVDSMALTLFDKHGNVVFKWGRAPNNVLKGIKIMKKKGIKVF